jgi:ApbE superfamily uncharacterized protein (UPF0280 family)
MICTSAGWVGPASALLGAAYAVGLMPQPSAA